MEGTRDGLGGNGKIDSFVSSYLSCVPTKRSSYSLPKRRNAGQTPTPIGDIKRLKIFCLELKYLSKSAELKYIERTCIPTKAYKARSLSVNT